MELCNENNSIEIPKNLNYETKGDDRLVSVLYRKIEELEKSVHDIQTKKIIDETQLPLDILENSGLLPSKKPKLKRGKGYRQLLQGEIEEAKKHSPFAAAQARWLGVHLCTYRKYAKMYGIYEPKPNEKGKRNMFDPDRGKFPISKILTGDFNGNKKISNWLVRDKLIRSKILPPKCNICGYDKRRITDNKIYILLDHKDGDLNNWKLDNLQLLCGNCTFECGRGYIRRGNHMFPMEPDFMEGARSDGVNSLSRY